MWLLEMVILDRVDEHFGVDAGSLEAVLLFADGEVHVNVEVVVRIEVDHLTGDRITARPAARPPGYRGQRVTSLELDREQQRRHSPQR